MTWLGCLLWGLLALLALALLVPVAVMVQAREGQPPQVRLGWLFLRVRLYPPKPLSPAKEKALREKRRKKELRKYLKRKNKESKRLSKKRKTVSHKGPEGLAEKLSLAVELMGALKGGLGLLVRRFRFYRIYVCLVVAKEDAAQTAIAYGKVNHRIYTAYAAAQSFLNLARPDLRIYPDFQREEGTWELDIRGRIAPVFVLAALASMAWGAMRLLLNNQKEGPPGQAKPPHTSKKHRPQPSMGGNSI